jgi:hypothetical protein
MDVRYLSSSFPYIMFVEVDYLPHYTSATFEWQCVVDDMYHVNAEVISSTTTSTNSSTNTKHWLACSIARVPNHEASLLSISDGSIHSDGYIIDTSEALTNDMSITRAWNLYGNSLTGSTSTNDASSNSSTNGDSIIATCGYILHPHLYTQEQLTQHYNQCSSKTNMSIAIYKDMNAAYTSTSGAFSNILTNASSSPPRKFSTLVSSIYNNSASHKGNHNRRSIGLDNTIINHMNIATTKSIDVQETSLQSEQCEIISNIDQSIVPCFSSVTSEELTQTFNLSSNDVHSYDNTQRIWQGQNAFLEQAFSNESVFGNALNLQEQSTLDNGDATSGDSIPKYLVIDEVDPLLIENPSNNSQIIIYGRTFTNTTTCLLNGINYGIQYTTVINSRFMECIIPPQGQVRDIGVVLTLEDTTFNLSSANGIILAYAVTEDSLLPDLLDTQTQS